MTRPWLLIASTGVTVGALFGLTGAVVLCLVAAMVVSLGRQRWAALGIIALVAALVGAARAEMIDQPSVDPVVATSTRAEGIIRSHPQSGPSGPRALLHVERVQLEDGAWTPASGDVLVFFGETVPGGIGNGDRVSVRWAVTPLERYDPGFQRFVLAGVLVRARGRSTPLSPTGARLPRTR